MSGPWADFIAPGHALEQCRLVKLANGGAYSAAAVEATGGTGYLSPAPLA